MRRLDEGMKEHLNVPIVRTWYPNFVCALCKDARPVSRRPKHFSWSGLFTHLEDEHLGDLERVLAYQPDAWRRTNA